MIEAVGDLFEYPADAVVIPVNWTVKRNGEAVMGAGVAKQAALKWPQIPKALGAAIQCVPKLPTVLYMPPQKVGYPFVVLFPTKLHWRDPSTLAMVEQSADALRTMTEQKAWRSVALPRVGCGLGGLSWDDVQPVLAKYLDDRFVVLTPIGAR